MITFKFNILKKNKGGIDCYVRKYNPRLDHLCQRLFAFVVGHPTGNSSSSSGTPPVKRTKQTNKQTNNLTTAYSYIYNSKMIL